MSVTRHNLFKLYSEYGEKDSPSVLVPKTQPDRQSFFGNKLIPTVQMVSEIAQENGLTISVRNCARYRGFVRVRFSPPNRFYRLISDEVKNREGQASGDQEGQQPVSAA